MSKRRSAVTAADLININESDKIEVRPQPWTAAAAGGGIAGLDRNGLSISPDGGADEEMIFEKHSEYRRARVGIQAPQTLDLSCAQMQPWHLAEFDFDTPDDLAHFTDRRVRL